MDVPLEPVAPNLFRVPVPEAGGRFTIQVDQAEGHRDGARPLPWRVDVRLAPEALAEHQAAEPLGACADFPGALALVMQCC